MRRQLIMANDHVAQLGAFGSSDAAQVILVGPAIGVSGAVLQGSRDPGSDAFGDVHDQVSLSARGHGQTDVITGCGCP